MINTLCKLAHKNAVAHGWWETKISFGQEIALMHSELSEALEDYRNNLEFNEIYFDGDKPYGIPVELADCVIRIFGICGAYKIDLQKAIIKKMAYNEKRTYKHGGKVI